MRWKMWLILCACCLLAACGQADGPPEADTPEPAPLEGVFVSDYGSLSFNGDGESISWDLDAEFAREGGLTAAQGQGAYVFLFHNEEWRYDKAERFVILEGEIRAEFSNVFGRTGEAAIVLALPWDAGTEVAFVREPAG